MNNKQIKAILNEPYNRLLSKKNSDKYANKDSMNELASILWSREDRKSDALIDSRTNDIAKELERFISQVKDFRECLRLHGDSDELRQDIVNCLNEYKAFSDAVL